MTTLPKRYREARKEYASRLGLYPGTTYKRVLAALMKRDRMTLDFVPNRRQAGEILLQHLHRENMLARDRHLAEQARWHRGEIKARGRAVRDEMDRGRSGLYPGAYMSVRRQHA